MWHYKVILYLKVLPQRLHSYHFAFWIVHLFYVTFRVLLYLKILPQRLHLSESWISLLWHFEVLSYLKNLATKFTFMSICFMSWISLMWHYRLDLYVKILPQSLHLCHFAFWISSLITNLSGIILNLHVQF